MEREEVIKLAQKEKDEMEMQIELRAQKQASLKSLLITTLLALWITLSNTDTYSSISVAGMLFTSIGINHSVYYGYILYKLTERRNMKNIGAFMFYLVYSIVAFYLIFRG